MGSGFVSKGFSVDLGSIHSNVTTLTLSLAAPFCPTLFLYLHLQHFLQTYTISTEWMQKSSTCFYI